MHPGGVPYTRSLGKFNSRCLGRGVGATQRKKERRESERARREREWIIKG